MLKINVIFAVLALMFGVFVFATSLMLASQKEMHTVTNVSERTFYVGRMLPDHILYPVVMVFDRALLVLAQDTKKIRTRIYLADDRFQRAELLLDKNQEALALTTLTKSQKYLIHATHEYLELESQVTPEQKEVLQVVGEELLVALVQNTFQLDAIRSEFKTVDTQPIGLLIMESKSLISVLELKV